MGKGGWERKNSSQVLMNYLFGHTLKIWLKSDCWLRLWILFAGRDGTARDGTGRDGTHRDYIDNLSLSFGFGPGLWLGLRFVNI